LREMLRLTNERLRATPFTTMASSRSKLLSRKGEKKFEQLSKTKLNFKAS
jgi:hypothetical protein